MEEDTLYTIFNSEHVPVGLAEADSPHRAVHSFLVQVLEESGTSLDKNSFYAEEVELDAQSDAVVYWTAV